MFIAVDFKSFLLFLRYDFLLKGKVSIILLINVVNLVVFFFCRVLSLLLRERMKMYIYMCNRCLFMSL